MILIDKYYSPFFNPLLERYMRMLLREASLVTTDKIWQCLVYNYQDDRRSACIRVACKRELRMRGIAIPAGLGAEQ